MDRAIASSGVVVVAIDMTLSGKPGPQTNRAYEMVKSFIARNVSS